MKRKFLIVLLCLLAGFVANAQNNKKRQSLLIVDIDMHERIRDSVLNDKYKHLTTNDRYVVQNAIDEFWGLYCKNKKVKYDYSEYDAERLMTSVDSLTLSLNEKQAKKDSLESELKVLTLLVNQTRDQRHYWSSQKAESDGWEEEVGELNREIHVIEEEITEFEQDKDQRMRKALADLNSAQQKMSELKEWESSLNKAVSDEVLKITKLIDTGKRSSLVMLNQSQLEIAKNSFESFAGILKEVDPESFDKLSSDMDYLNMMVKCSGMIDEAKAFLKGLFQENNRATLQQKMETIDLARLSAAHRKEYEPWFDAILAVGGRVSEYNSLLSGLLAKDCIQKKEDFDECYKMINEYEQSCSPKEWSYYTSLRKSCDELKSLFKKEKDYTLIFVKDELIYPDEYKAKLNSIWGMVSNGQLTTPQH